MDKKKAKKILDTIENYSGLVLNPMFLIGATAITVAGLSVKQEIDQQRQSCTLNEDANRIDSKMMKAAYKNKLEVFKQSLDNGASIETVNKLGQDALMVALSGDSYDVAKHILETPELANKIDYKRYDQNSVCLGDIIEAKLLENPTPELVSIKRQVDKNREEQIKEEARGKSRSNTCWDVMSMVDKSVLEK